MYTHRDHVIDVFVAPDIGHLRIGSAAGNRSGYNYLSWRSGGMVFWAVSDLNARELADFVRLWQTR